MSAVVPKPHTGSTEIRYLESTLRIIRKFILA
jgi:hypothetical protein